VKVLVVPIADVAAMLNCKLFEPDSSRQSRCTDDMIGQGKTRECPVSQ
jgi:hypothetical protein